jgi:hypothetical protein
VKQDYIANKEHPLPWAVTTQLTMKINDFNIVAAIEKGSGLTREIYFGLLAGTQELYVFPSGIKLIVPVSANKHGRAS